MHENLKIEDLKTARYKCATINSPAVTGFYLERCVDGLTTPLSVCSEGIEYYAGLKAAFRKRRALFDALASEHFVRGSTVYNVAGDMGWIGEDGGFCK